MSTSPPVVDISPPLMGTSPPLMDTSPPLMDTSPPSMGGPPPPKVTAPLPMDTSSSPKRPSTPLGIIITPRNASGHLTTPDRCSNIDGLSSACHRNFDTSPPLSPSLVSALSAAAKSRSPSPSLGGLPSPAMGGSASRSPLNCPSPLLYRCPPPSPCGTHRLLLNNEHASIAVSGSSVHDKDFAVRVEEVLRRRLTVEDGWRLVGESDSGLPSESSCESDREWCFQPQDPEEDEEEELTIYVARPGGMKDDASSAALRNVSNAIMKSDSKMHDVAGSISVSLRAPDLSATLPISDPTPPPSIRWGPGRKSYGVLGTRRTPSSQPILRSIPSTLVDGASSAGPVFVPSARPVFVPSARPNVVQGVRPNAIPIVRPDGTRLDVIARPDAVSSPHLHIPDQQAPIEMPVMAMQSLRSADMPSPSFDSAYASPGGIPDSPSSDASYPTSLTSYPASPMYSPTSPIASPPFTPTKQRSPMHYRSVTEPLAALGPWSPAPYVGARVSRARFWGTVSEPLQDKLPQAGWGRERTASERSYDHLGADNSVAPFGADHIASPPTTPGFSHDDEEDWSWALAGGQGAPAVMDSPSTETVSRDGSRPTSMEEDWRAMQDTSLRSSMQSDRRSSAISGLRSSIDASTRSSPQNGRRSSTEGTIPTERNWRATQQFDWRASRSGRPVRRSWEVKDGRVSEGGARKISDSGVHLLSDGGVRLVSDSGVRKISDSGARFVSDSGMTSDSAVHGRDSTNASLRRVVSDGRLDLQLGRLDLPPGRLDLPPGRLDLPPGRLDLPPGRLDSPLGPMSLPRSPLSPSRGPSSSPRGPLSPTRGPLSPTCAPLSPSYAPLSPSYAPPSSRTQRSFARASSTPEGILRHSDYDILRHSDYGILRHSDDGILHQPGIPRHRDSRRTNSARHVHFGGEQRVVSGGGQRVVPGGGQRVVPGGGQRVVSRGGRRVTSGDVFGASPLSEQGWRNSMSPPGEQGWRDDRATEDVDPLQNAVDMVRKAIDAVKKAVEPAGKRAVEPAVEVAADAGGGTVADAGSGTMNVGHRNKAIDHEKSTLDLEKTALDLGETALDLEKSTLDGLVYREVMRAALGDGWEVATPTASPRMPTGEQRAPTASPRTAATSPRQGSGTPRKASDDQSPRPRSKGDEDKKGGEGDAKGTGEGDVKGTGEGNAKGSGKGDAKGSGKAPHPRSKRDRRGRPDAKGAKGTQGTHVTSQGARTASQEARAPSKSPRKKSKDPSQSRDGRALDEAIRAAMQDEPLPTWQVSKDRTSNVVALQMQALAMSQAASDAKAPSASSGAKQPASKAVSKSASKVKSQSASNAKPGPASAAMSQSASDAEVVGTGKTTFWDNARGTYVAQNASSQLVC